MQWVILVLVIILVFLLIRLRKGAKRADAKKNCQECKLLYHEGAEMFLMKKELPDGWRSLIVAGSCCKDKLSTDRYEVARTFLAGQEVIDG